MAIPDWLTLSKTSGSNSDTVDITASKNDGSAREATLIIASDSLQAQINVTQESNMKRTVSLDAFLVSFGRTEEGKYENVYGFQAVSDYVIDNGNVSISISVKGPTTETITRKTVTINTGSKESEVVYVPIYASQVIDTSTRFTTSKINKYVSYTIINNTPYTVTKRAVMLSDSRILTITGSLFNNEDKISYELRNLDNTPVDMGNLVNTYYLIVSWPYRGGYNICSYKVTRTYEVTDTIYHIEYVFELPTVSLDIGGGIIKEYYDIWNCIMNKNYIPVKKFKLTSESYKANLAHKSTVISDVELVTGQLYGYLRLNADGTISTVNSPYKAGLADDSGYGGLTCIISNNSTYDSKIINWYHRPLLENEEMVTTVFKRIPEGFNFSSTDFLETTTGNILAYSHETAAEKDESRTITSSEDNMEMFYHPYKHPNSIIVGN